MNLILAATMLLEGFLIPTQDPVEIQIHDAVVAQHGAYDCSSDQRWAGLIAAYFPESEMCTALRIVACESLGKKEAINPRSGATGLFQVMPFWARHYGYERRDLLDPSINTEIAYRIWSEEGGWRHWSCY